MSFYRYQSVVIEVLLTFLTELISYFTKSNYVQILEKMRLFCFTPDFTDKFWQLFLAN